MDALLDTELPWSGDTDAPVPLGCVEFYRFPTSSWPHSFHETLYVIEGRNVLFPGDARPLIGLRRRVYAVDFSILYRPGFLELIAGRDFLARYTNPISRLQEACRKTTVPIDTL